LGILKKNYTNLGNLPCYLQLQYLIVYPHFKFNWFWFFTSLQLRCWEKEYWIWFWITMLLHMIY